MSDANVPADPGNSAPEDWSEPLTPGEEQEAKNDLAAHAAERETDAENSDAGLAAADFVVVDGEVRPVEKNEPVEPAPVEYRSDEEVALDAEPVEMAVDQTPEVDGDGSSSPSN